MNNWEKILNMWNPSTANPTYSKLVLFSVRMIRVIENILLLGFKGTMCLKRQIWQSLVVELQNAVFRALLRFLQCP